MLPSPATVPVKTLFVLSASYVNPVYVLAVAVTSAFVVPVNDSSSCSV